MVIKIDSIMPYVESGHLAMQEYADLLLFNYTAKTQYESLWNPITRACRGLIFHKDGRIAARPFEKFFNLHEHDPAEIPREPFEVREKLDGSLGILFWTGGAPRIATRGSFSSEQACRANLMLSNQYRPFWPSLNPDYTYLFEIIYPANRIVVDYGDEEKLVLLAVIDKVTGQDQPLEHIGFPVARRYDGILDLRELAVLPDENKEGFVVRFESGFRVKVKFEDYVRIHRLITQVSTKTIWKMLRDGEDLAELLERVPDEFYAWVRITIADFRDNYERIENRCRFDFRVLDTRKETAIYFQSCSYPSVLFAMLDEKPYEEIIWKMLRPDYARPFRGDLDGSGVVPA